MGKKGKRSTTTLAAKKGHLESVYFLGHIYDELDDNENAAKHWIFAARAGHSASMDAVRKNKINGNYVMSDDDLDAIEEAYKDAAKQEWSEEREAFKRQFEIRQSLGWT